MLFVQIETNTKGVLVMKADLLERFEQCESQMEQIKVMRSFLESRGIDEVSIKKSRGISTDYYIGEDAVLAIIKRSDGDEFPAVTDKAIYDEYLKDGKGSISYNVRAKRGDRENYKLWYCSKQGQMELHRLVATKGVGQSLKEKGQYLTGKCVDHKFHSPLINTSEALRICTDQQNAWNRDPLSYKRHVDAELNLEKMKAKGDFAYNPLEDYTYTWYAYIIYKMTGDITEDNLRDYNREFICKHEPAKAKYYKSLLAS